MKFADFRAGLVLKHGPASLGEQDIVSFAEQWDPQWFHRDPRAAAASRFGGLIASGWQTCGLAMRMAVECALEGSESFASPGLEYLKWPHPVRAGEPLVFRGDVLETRRSRSQPDLGIMRWRWHLLHEDGRAALDAVVTSLFDLGKAPAG
jgi:acyl dehydratase